MSAKHSTHDDIMIVEKAAQTTVPKYKGHYFQPTLSDPGFGTHRAILKLTAGGVAKTMRL
jgi:hypothetical protein